MIVVILCHLIQLNGRESSLFSVTSCKLFVIYGHIGRIRSMPQKYIYICLDVFKEKQDNEDVTIHNKLEAWLTILCRDEPEKVIELIEQYPEFKALYEDIYILCHEIEKVMGMFSKELLEMDRNTVKLMIDEMQEEAEELLKERDKAAEELAKANEEILRLKKLLEER